MVNTVKAVVDNALADMAELSLEQATTVCRELDAATQAIRYVQETRHSITRYIPNINTFQGSTLDIKLIGCNTDSDDEGGLATYISEICVESSTLAMLETLAEHVPGVLNKEALTFVASSYPLLRMFRDLHTSGHDEGTVTIHMTIMSNKEYAALNFGQWQKHFTVSSTPYTE